MHILSKINFGKTKGIVYLISREGFRKAGKFSHICKVINHMKDEIYSALLLKKKIRRKSFALLIDPDKVDQAKLPALGYESLDEKLAELTLANINLDVAIIGVDGVSATAGLTTHHEVEAQTNRSLLRAAARVIVVADSTKIGRRGFARISEIGAVSDLVTDAGAQDSAVAELERAGLRVHRAGS